MLLSKANMGPRMALLWELQSQVGLFICRWMLLVDCIRGWWRTARRCVFQASTIAIDAGLEMLGRYMYRYCLGGTNWRGVRWFELTSGCGVG